MADLICPYHPTNQLNSHSYEKFKVELNTGFFFSLHHIPFSIDAPLLITLNCKLPDLLCLHLYILDASKLSENVEHLESRRLQEITFKLSSSILITNNTHHHSMMLQLFCSKFQDITNGFYMHSTETQKEISKTHTTSKLALKMHRLMLPMRFTFLSSLLAISQDFKNI